MNKKLLSTIFTFSSVIAITSIIITTIILYYFFSGELQNELKDQMGFLKPGVETQGETYLKEVNVPERITLINPKGDVIYDNFRSTPLENHLNREEVKEALENGEGYSIRFSETLNENTYYYAIRLNNGNILRISMDQASLFQILFGFLQIYLLLIIGAVIISFFISKKLVTSITDSIKNLDPDHPSPNPDFPELTPLLFKIENQNRQIKEQLKKVNRQKADFETVTANMNEGIIITDKNGFIKNINDSARKFLNVTEPVKNISIFRKVKNEKLQNLIENALNGEKRSIVLSDAKHSFSIIASPIIVKEKQTGVVLIIIDVTERVQMEKLRAEYVSNISHELKTPLTSISGFAEIMNNDLVKPEDIHYFSGKIYDEAQNLIQMVNNILTIGYLDESNNNILKVKINLELIAQEVVDRLEQVAKNRGINIKIISRGNTEFFGNPDILSELLFNLIENAIKYNKKYGKVIIYLKGKSPSSLILKVIDSGVGIAGSDIDRIFERFYRPDRNRSSKNYGTGLGLSIVKHAALVHKAQIHVSSALNKGSVFELNFPRNFD